MPRVNDLALLIFGAIRSPFAVAPRGFTYMASVAQERSMTHMRLFVVAMWLVVCGVALQGQETRAGKLLIEPYSFRTFDGQETAAELGKLWVRENRDSPAGRVIQLTFVRLASTAKTPGSPIVFLAGGPGAPGIGMGRVPVYFRLFDRLRAVADVILLDQRGVGMSSPELQCPVKPVPVDAFETPEKWLRVLTDKSRSCAAYWQAKGVDVAAYTNDASADDLDDLRKALGVDRISLVGHSYGTLLAQTAVRRHGKHLDRVVFAGTLGSDDLVPLPSVWETLFAKLSHLAAKDVSIDETVPDMDALYRRVLDRLHRQPVTLTVTDPQTRKPVTIRVGKIGLQWLVRHTMTDARNYARLPALFQTIDRGDHSLLTRYIEPLYHGFQGRSPMANAVDCSIGWSPERLARANREAQQSSFGNVHLQRTAGFCNPVGIDMSRRRSPVRLYSELPALFVSGTLDTNTPPFQAEEVRWGFPNSTHLIVENGGHETLPSAEVQTVIVDFFRGENVSGRAITFAPPDFLSVEEAKAQAASRR
jgi:pimeloyl-ACP methyl ester carboxylesterase